MAAVRLHLSRVLWSANVGGGSLLLGQAALTRKPRWDRRRAYATDEPSKSKEPSLPIGSSDAPSDAASPHDTPSSSSSSSSSKKQSSFSSSTNDSIPAGWEDEPNFDISNFSQLPYKNFGVNQHMIINAEFKEALRQVLWQFRAPIRYAFAYGSGVFPQSSRGNADGPSPHPQAPEAVVKWQKSGGKILDFIFGVSYTQHWHDINIQQHRDHYSFLGSLGSGLVSKVQDNFGAGAYFNPYINVNGLLIKYGVVNLDTIYRDLSDWETLYIAGRLQKPVKILRDDPRIRLANQVNLISALRTALLMLPSEFTEKELYTKIAGISYMGDPRMSFNAESPSKVADIVESQMPNFRQLYSPLIMDLPNVQFNDPNCSKDDWATSDEYNCHVEQDMEPKRRGNMVRRLPKSFRKKLYNAYRGVFEVPESQFEGLMLDDQSDGSFSRREGDDFDQKIAADKNLENMVGEAIKRTVSRPTTTQTVKGLLTAGVARGWRYLSEKRAKGKQRKDEAAPLKNSDSESEKSKDHGKKQVQEKENRH